MLKLKRYCYSEVKEKATITINKDSLEEIYDTIVADYQPIKDNETIPTITEDMVKAVINREDFDDDIKIRWKGDKDNEGFNLSAAISDALDDMLCCDADWETIDSDTYETSAIEIEDEE